MTEPQNPVPEEPTASTPPPPPPPQGYSDPGAAPAASNSMGVVGAPAELLPRFLARLIDSILLGVVSAVIVTVIIVGAIMGESGGGFGYGGGIAAGLVTSILGAVINFGYFGYLESTRGQTVGKMLLKLETRAPGGGHPTFEQAVKRNIFYAIGLASWIPILGLFAGLGQLAAVIMVAVTINNSATKQGWHDNFAGGTTVVKIG